MKTKLVKTITTRNGKYEQRVTITVSYDPCTFEVVILSIEYKEVEYWQAGSVIEYSSLSTVTDVTESMLEAFPSMFKDVQNMNWEEIYREAKRMEVAA